LHQLTCSRAIPVPGERDETITLTLEAGRGLVEPTHLPSRRGMDRGRIDESRMLLVS
ncbi:MAG: hypothetical protein GWN71_10755, partial [Gammaproteobacteria bacterium]|nr:hypothetical protein [Gemmatimonadota bacterium]NIU74039.1 hypothetical protein [Gammaproteobacteria bacterium]